MEETTPKQVNASEYKEENGKLIGRLSNLNEAYEWLRSDLEFDVRDFGKDKDIDVDKLKLSIDTYMGIRYCYNGDTTLFDNSINQMVNFMTGFVKHIGYKRIQIN